MDENLARKIVEVIAPAPDETIVEIGPGFGALTGHLRAGAGRLVAVEIDRHLCAHLEQTLGQFQNFELIAADFLKVDFARFSLDEGAGKIVGNIPYQITSPVLFKIFANCNVVSQAVLMIQKEVAERIVARPRTKAYGILSVLSQFYSEPSIQLNASRHVFRPKPDVASSLVKWDFLHAGRPAVTDLELFVRVVRTTFNQRRKMLRNSLQRVPEASNRLAEIAFDLTRRPEELTVAEFAQLANMVSSL